MLHLGIPFREVAPERVLVIGCGAGTGPMTLHQDYPEIKRIDVVDIDPAVFRVAHKYFRFPENSPEGVIKSHIKDGRIFIHHSPEKSYDYIILDMPPITQTSITPRLASFMDMVLMVIDSGKTSRDVVSRANSLLEESRANVAVVLNRHKAYVPKRMQQEI